MQQLLKAIPVSDTKLQCYHTSLQVFDAQAKPLPISLLALKIYIVRIGIDQPVDIIVTHTQADRVNIYGDISVEADDGVTQGIPERFEPDFVTAARLTLTPFTDASRPSRMVTIRIFPDHSKLGPGSFDLKATEGYRLAFIRT